jgi:hypothetical protein
MRTWPWKLGWLGGVLLVAASCRSNPDLKPPKPPESYALPPASDPRFSQPPIYPKDRSQDDFFKSKQDTDPANQLGKPGGMGAGPGRM